MKVSLIAAVTADGFIGHSSDQAADWTGSEDKKLFVRLTKEAGTIVMGARTFATIGRALPGRRVIVYTTGKLAPLAGVETTAEPPAVLLERLEGEGCTSLAICGGQAIYELFMAGGFVDELYLTFVPVLFGAGLTLLATKTHTRLEILETSLLSDGCVFTHYNVCR